MKKFIYKTVAFISFFVFMLISVLLVNKYFARIKVDKNRSMIVVGHSHSECAFNDSIVNVVNFSLAGEANFYTYFKLKKILELNPRIVAVFIQFSNNQIDEYMNNWIWDEMHMSHQLPLYALFLDSEGLKLLHDKNPESFKQCIFPILKHSIKMIFKGLNYNNEIGGYRYLIRDKTDSLLIAAPVDDPLDDLNNLSEINIEYLSRSINYCKQKNIKVFLVRTPLHEKSQYYNNELLFQKILKTNFAETEFLDFSKYPIANSEFADLEHLNYKGAKNFSVWFAHLIENGILQKDNKQEFIDTEIKIRAGSNAYK